MTITHQPDPATALWVSAHPTRDSFTGRLMQAGIDELSREYTVTTSDLYAQGFDPRLSERDLGAVPEGYRGVVDRMGDASAAGLVPEDVRQEQAKLAAASLVILQFPLWWYGPPAMLKGWFDRVLTNGFAYGDDDPTTGIPRRYGDAPLAGRRALVIVTAGEDDRSIGSRGISGDIDSLLFPITHGTLWYTGIEALELHVVHDADGLDIDGMAQETERLTSRLRHLDAESPQAFRRLSDGEYRGTRALREDILPGRTDLGIHTH
ncbi:MAG TPA: NAD(P)H-dependent oxidoreductase [Plantibacter sp.]|uniref:NAD(P)H-dependent oxidoreductase n=1 Tax=unclassified Plantibacter TaxID=2624265 RepID=UPI002B8921A4|nr:NAD(P)H-dependent oxidoreductase [Plantibacter sp.]